jgi:hypothetical protein
MFMFAGCSCIMSTIPQFRFILVRHSIVALLSEIGRAFVSSVAFSVATPQAIATIGLYISYGMRFQLPKYSYPLHESSYQLQEIAG